MVNPFKFGTVVEDCFFTDRRDELQYIKSVLNSENHLILISPRRFGKTSLVVKVLHESERKHIMLNLQSVVSVEDFAGRLLKEIFRIYKFEKIKYLIKNFRVMPTFSLNPMTDGVDVAIQPMVDNRVLIEDVFALLQTLATEEDRIIVVFDEFQEITNIDKNLDRLLRAIMQLHKNINYLFLGSQESMMREIFEKKKSPFFHFSKSSFETTMWSIYKSMLIIKSSLYFLRADSFIESVIDSSSLGMIKYSSLRPIQLAVFLIYLCRKS